MRIVKGSTVMTRTTLKMATFMLATAIRPTQDQPNSTSDNVRQWSDSPTGPTGPTVPTVPTVRQCPTVPDRAHRPCHSDKGPTVRQLPDSCPTVVRQLSDSSNPTVPDSVRQFRQFVRQLRQFRQPGLNSPDRSDHPCTDCPPVHGLPICTRIDLYVHIETLIRQSVRTQPHSRHR
mgnify:CR=1 FL=1